MPRASLVFLDPSLVLSIHPARFAALLRAWRVKLAVDPLTAPPVDVAREAWGLSCDARFAEVADVLVLLATDVGNASLLAALKEERRRAPTHLPPADLAAVILARRAARATGESWEVVLEEALLQFARLVPDAYGFERVGREARAVADPAPLVAEIARVLGERFVDAWLGKDDDGVIHVAVLRREAPRAGVKGTKRVVRRDTACDVLRIDVPEARLTVRTSEPQRVAAYAAAVGRALYADDAFFGESAAFTGRPLAKLGSAGLASARPAGVSRVRAVDLSWDDGEGTTHHTHGSDALAAYEKRGGPAGGYLLSAMLRMDAPGHARPIDAAFRAPNRVAFREARHEPLGRAVLSELALTRPGAEPDDVWTLAPGTQAEWRWARVLPADALEALRARKVLVPAKGARMVAGRPEEKLGWQYIAFELKSRPGARYAVASDPSLPPRLVREEEMSMWRLDAAAAARALAVDLCAEPGSERTGERVGESCVNVGVVRGRGATVHVWAALRSPGTAKEARALVEAMTRASRGAQVVVLLPEGRTVGAGIEIGLPDAELLGARPIAAKVLARIGERIGVAGFVEPWRRVAADVRFVAEEATGRCWLDHVELVRVSDVCSRMLVELAKARGGIVATKALEAIMSPRRTAKGAASETAERLAAWIAESFALAGREPPADYAGIVEAVVNKGWRMVVSCAVV